MPKRRMTAARKRQIAQWNLAGLRARLGKSHPSVKRAQRQADFRAGKLDYTPPGLGGRRSKQGGKAYTKKSGSNFKPSQEAKDLIAGKTTIARTSAAHEAAGIDHNGKRLAASPRGGGHKMAPSLKSVGAVHKKPPGYKGPNQLHGSGTGLTSAYRYTKKRGK